jgi:hypothetical protein
MRALRSRWRGLRCAHQAGANRQPVRGLLRRLPKPGEKWEHEKRARWLQTLAANFDMVFVSDEDDKIIVVECKAVHKSE